MTTDTLKRFVNASFITNNELLEVLRNKSSKISRENSFKDLTEHVHLLKKKSYVSITKPIATQSTSHTQIIQLIKQASQMLPSAHQAHAPLEQAITILTSIQPREALKEIVTQETREQVKSKLVESEKENMLLRKIEQLCREKASLKRQKDQLQDKLKKLTGKDTANMQQIILSQSELINKQCDQHSRQNIDLRAMLYSQAKQLEIHFKTPNSTEGKYISKGSKQSTIHSKSRHNYSLMRID